MAISNIFLPKRSLFILVQILLPLSSVYSSSASKNNNRNHFISPVPNLEASLAASAAHTTVVAVQSFRNYDGDESDSNDSNDSNDSEDCIVLLSRTPPIDGRETVFNLTRSSDAATAAATNGENRQSPASKDGKDDDDDDDDNEWKKEKHLIPIFSRGSVKMRRFATTTNDDGDDDETSTSPGRSPKRPHATTEEGRENHNLHILQPSSSLCLAVTGFALDKTHLVRCAAELVSNHEYVYGWGGRGRSGSSSPSSTMDVHRMVREDLAPKMRDAAFAGGDRPFGVDLMVVGSDHRRGGTDRSMVMYTIDPSGNWKHWGGGGTCIGKGADRVRKQLYRTLYCRDDDDDVDEESEIRPPTTWVRALEVAMEATFKTMDLDESAAGNDESRSNEIATADYDAIVLFGNDNDAGREGLPRCAIIDRQFVADMYRKCADNARQEKLRKRKKKLQS